MGYQCYGNSKPANYYIPLGLEHKRKVMMLSNFDNSLKTVFVAIILKCVGLL